MEQRSFRYALTKSLTSNGVFFIMARLFVLDEGKNTKHYVSHRSYVLATWTDTCTLSSAAKTIMAE